MANVFAKAVNVPSLVYWRTFTSVNVALKVPRRDGIYLLQNVLLFEHQPTNKAQNDHQQ